MSAKHQTPEYQRNARILRKRWTPEHQAGRLVCWRCRRRILPGEPFDVGHLPHARASALHELAPEHRHRSRSCIGNRAAGGRQGASITNRRHRIDVPTTNETTWTI
ncbi:hypothetical protein [Microbacterium sp. XT11]|uniref:hypothetical protein n=1 Tax=Microbacterium sp. XT11 TaxID=367477 RepID=UPI000832B9E0|nr:hypothetical protein [Microbacterium sp. XT11]